MTSGRLRAVIVDDEPLAVRRLRFALDEMGDVEVVDVAGNGQAALKLIQATRPDIAFLDIKMPVMNGLELSAALPPGDRPVLIFVTAFSRFAVDAFEAAAVDYLLKPVEFDRLRAAIDRARVSRQSEDAGTRIAELLALIGDLQAADAEADRVAPPRRGCDFWVVEKNVTARVPLDQVEMLAAEGDYVRIYTSARSHLVKDRLGALAERLAPAGFLRVHRSTLVRASAIEKLISRPAGGVELILGNGRAVPVGRSYLSRVRQLKRRRLEAPTRC